MAEITANITTESEEITTELSSQEQTHIEMFYFATTHSLLELAKKLAFKKAVLNQDKVIEKKKEIECLIDIILKTLSI